MCQVGDGELKGRDVKRLIGASIVGTPYEAAFQIESVWRKVRSEFPAALQAANKISVEDARAQWTTYNNLDQWFDDVKKDLIGTGLVEDKVVLDADGKLVSEVSFKSDSQQRIINMDETHHNLSITGDKGGSCSVTYHNPLLQRGANRGVKSARHVTGMQQQQLERCFLHSTFLTQAPNQKRSLGSESSGLLGYRLSVAGLDAQHFKRICTASMLFDLADRWTNHSSISILSL